MFHNNSLMNQMMGWVLSPTFLTFPSIRIRQDVNKTKIFNCLQEFRANNTDVSQIIVLGSSCMLCMDYAYKADITDVDIFCDRYRHEVTMAKDIDVMEPNRLFLPSDYKTRLVECNGFFFLSKEDLIINMISTFYKQKESNRSYLEILLLNTDLPHIYAKFSETYENYIKTITDIEFAKRFQITMSYFPIKYTEQYINRIATMQQKLYDKLQQEMTLK